MLYAALKAIAEEGISQWAATKQFGIPKTMLQNAKKGLYETHKRGPQGVLTKEEETYFRRDILYHKLSKLHTQNWHAKRRR